MRPVLTALLVLVGLVPATLHAAPAPTYGVVDAPTDLARSYFGARYYASRTGRFTTVDPGHVGGNIFDPQSWNAYAYARNDPLRFVDPTGTEYFVAIEGGTPFWIDNDRDLWKYELGGVSFRSGRIYNAANQDVGGYQHFGRFERVLFESGRQAAPGVNFAIGLGAAQVGLLAGGAAITAAGETTVILGGMGGSMAGAISQISNSSGARCAICAVSGNRSIPWRDRRRRAIHT